MRTEPPQILGRALTALALAASVPALARCSEPDSGHEVGSAAGGTNASGGSRDQGGATPASGGSNGDRGGARTTGGSSGGAPPTGGTGPGGTTAGLGATGGAATTGGAQGTGGASPLTGGQAGAGAAGNSDRGGKANTAGNETAGSPMTLTGGALNSGGAPGSGGRANGGMGGATSGGGANAGAAGLGGDSLCEAAQFLLCESFETASVGANPMGWSKSGSPTVVDDQAARGKRSLKIPPAANGGGRILRSAMALGSGHFGRIFYRVATPPPLPSNGNVIHSTVVALSGTSPNGGGNTEWRVVDTVENSAGMHQYLYNVQPSGSEFGKGSAYNYKFDGAWHCAEWNIDAATQTYRFYIDGAELTQISISNGAGNFGSGANRSDIPNSFNELRIGWTNYQSAGSGFTAWIDEIAVASSRIGCNH